MPSQDNQLRRLQDVIVERLKDHAALGALPIYSETQGDLASEIEISLGKLGIVLVVQAVKAGISNPNLKEPTFDSITFAVEVWEDVTLNRKISALDAAVAVVKQLYQFRPTDVFEFSGRTILPAANTLEPLAAEGNNGYYVNLKIG